MKNKVSGILSSVTREIPISDESLGRRSSVEPAGMDTFCGQSWLGRNLVTIDKKQGEHPGKLMASLLQKRNSVYS